MYTTKNKGAPSNGTPLTPHEHYNRVVKHKQQLAQPSMCHHCERTRLPSPASYYEAQGLTLKGKWAWRDAICPFHDYTKPSLRVRLETCAFSCMACGEHGGDVLAFHMKRYGLTFKAAAASLGAWIGGAQ